MCLDIPKLLSGIYKRDSLCYNNIIKDNTVAEKKKIIRPVPGSILEGMLFGVLYPPEIQKMTGKTSHRGIDYLAIKGTECEASGGEIVNVYDDKTLFGLYVVEKVVLDDGNILFNYFAHLTRQFVSIGYKTKLKEIICITGASGDATRLENGKMVEHPHLHFESRLNSRLSSAAVDPKIYM